MVQSIADSGAKGNQHLPDKKRRIHDAVFQGGEAMEAGYLEWAGEYDADLRSIEYTAAAVGAEHAVKYLQGRDQPRTIDLGAGTGLVADEIRARRPQFGTIDALDLSQAMLDEAAKKGLYSKLFCQPMGASMPFFKTAEYDCAVCIGTFGHGHVGPDAVEETLRILKPGAPFIFSVRKSVFDSPKYGWNKTLGQLMADDNCVLEEKVEFQYMKDVAGYTVVLSKCHVTCKAGDIHLRTLTAKDAEENQQVYDEWAKNYEKDILDGGYQCYMTVAKKLFESAPDAKLVMDAGCGTGLVGEALVSLSAAAGRQVVVDGCDYSQGILDELRVVRPDRYRRTDQVDLKKTLPYANGEYDAVVCAGVLVEGHCGVECVAEMVRVIRPGGSLVFTLRATFYDDASKGWKGCLETLEKAGHTVRLEDFAYLEGVDGKIVQIVVK